jgi:hypothetical protein
MPTDTGNDAGVSPPSSDNDSNNSDNDSDNPHAHQRILQRRQQEWGEPQSDSDEVDRGVNNSFATAFGRTSEFSDAARARSRQYEQLVQDEVERELAEERRRRLVGGVGTAADGSVLFSRRRQQNRNSSDRGYKAWLAAGLQDGDSEDEKERLFIPPPNHTK